MLSQNKEIVLSSGVHNENSRRPRKIQRVRRVRKKIQSNVAAQKVQKSENSLHLDEKAF